MEGRKGKGGQKEKKVGREVRKMHEKMLQNTLVQTDCLELRVWSMPNGTVGRSM